MLTVTKTLSDDVSAVRQFRKATPAAPMSPLQTASSTASQYSSCTTEDSEASDGKHTSKTSSVAANANDQDDDDGSPTDPLLDATTRNLSVKSITSIGSDQSVKSLEGSNLPPRQGKESDPVRMAKWKERKARKKEMKEKQAMKSSGRQKFSTSTGANYGSWLMELRKLKEQLPRSRSPPAVKVSAASEEKTETKAESKEKVSAASAEKTETKAESKEEAMAKWKARRAKKREARAQDSEGGKVFYGTLIRETEERVWSNVGALAEYYQANEDEANKVPAGESKADQDKQQGAAECVPTPNITSADKDPNASSIETEKHPNASSIETEKHPNASSIETVGEIAPKLPVAKDPDSSDDENHFTVGAFGDVSKPDNAPKDDEAPPAVPIVMVAEAEDDCKSPQDSQLGSPGILSNRSSLGSAEASGIPSVVSTPSKQSGIDESTDDALLRLDRALSKAGSPSSERGSDDGPPEASASSVGKDPEAMAKYKERKARLKREKEAKAASNKGYGAFLRATYISSDQGMEVPNGPVRSESTVTKGVLNPHTPEAPVAAGSSDREDVEQTAPRSSQSMVVNAVLSTLSGSTVNSGASSVDGVQRIRSVPVTREHSDPKKWKQWMKKSAKSLHNRYQKREVARTNSHKQGQADSSSSKQASVARRLSRRLSGFHGEAAANALAGNSTSAVLARRLSRRMSGFHGSSANGGPETGSFGGITGGIKRIRSNSPTNGNDAAALAASLRSSTGLTASAAAAATASAAYAASASAKASSLSLAVATPTMSVGRKLHRSTSLCIGKGAALASKLSHMVLESPGGSDDEHADGDDNPDTTQHISLSDRSWLVPPNSVLRLIMEVRSSALDLDNMVEPSFLDEGIDGLDDLDWPFQEGVSRQDSGGSGSSDGSFYSRTDWAAGQVVATAMLERLAAGLPGQQAQLQNAQTLQNAAEQ
eukprot:gnl/TRDRNA2_/TRDRNA2_137353_c0_seq2.p1 gnl/TRDRNA2_/TRDRNA2_137353_c0~~gnl/TRDRNA2_/TRDRNA2_137353_c0_seq2.p1  ORF type:complete len:966 (-),score=172.03 gnl/TRDRNA2_/TRDRNA2_137353_c0_seq2:64-2886(-)